MTEWKIMTASDIANLVGSRAVHQVGDRIQPMIYEDDSGGGHREVVEVVERIELPDGFGGIAVRYLCRRADGTTITVRVSDDPRPADPGDELG